MSTAQARQKAEYHRYLEDNPCVKEHDDSLQCLNRTGSKQQCRTFFDAYNECMKRWRKQVREQRLKANAGA